MKNNKSPKTSSFKVVDWADENVIETGVIIFAMLLCLLLAGGFFYFVIV